MAKNRLINVPLNLALSGTLTVQIKNFISFIPPSANLSGEESAMLLARTISAGRRRLKMHPAVRMDATTGGLDVEVDRDDRGVGGCVGSMSVRCTVEKGYMSVVWYDAVQVDRG